ncbi:uncharacterized protein LOC134721600 isoform X2 [Mytilus trossulus]|uniref:uncharacterized protein LOC134721600 isoform X2 n=1 Tax=Mytilus trossulus TaxID=6551 RepID=UPI003003B8EE
MTVNILWVSVWMVFMLFLSEAKVTWNVTWNVVKQIAYGEDLELFCMSDEYNMSSTKSKRWYRGPEQKLLTLNGGSMNNKKYNASIESKGFKLIIKNCTENDVNVTYQCEYGFTKSEKLLLLAEDVFKKDFHKNKEELQEIDSKTAVILGIVIGVFIVICILVFAILYKRFRGQFDVVTNNCFTKQSQNAEDPYVEVQYDAVPPNETNGNDNQPTNIDQYEGVRNHPAQPNESNGINYQETIIANRFGHHPSSGNQYDGVRNHPAQPNESNGINYQETIIANRFGHHPSSEDIETSATPQSSFQPEIATSFSRIGACKTPQPQQLGDEYNETHHVADTDRSIVSSQQEAVVISNNGSHISNPNQEEEFIISSAKFPAYSKKRVREQSFTEWSLSEPSKQKMASAGFFYKGCNTYAQCFCCGFNQKWKENDDPLSSSLHYDNCLYSEKVNNISAQASNPRSPANEETNPKSME